MGKENPFGLVAKKSFIVKSHTKSNVGDPRNQR